MSAKAPVATASVAIGFAAADLPGYVGSEGAAAAAAPKKAGVASITKAMSRLAVGGDVRKDNLVENGLVAAPEKPKAHHDTAAAVAAVNVVEVWQNFHAAAKELSYYMAYSPIRDYSMAHTYAERFQKAVNEAQADREGLDAKKALGVSYHGLPVEISRLVNEIVIAMIDRTTVFTQEGKFKGYIYADDSHWALQAAVLLKALAEIKPKDL